MRKVYHNERSVAAVAVAVAFSACFTALLFGILPFAHQVAKPDKTLELRKASVADVPPPEEEKDEAPPPEPEAPKDSAPEPQLAETQQQIPMSADLEVALGSGGALAGYGEVQAMTAMAEETGSDAFDVADLEKRPEVIAQVAPTYPAELRKAKVEGTVTLVFLLDETGRVEDPRVDASSRPEFEKPAMDAIKRWRFKPGQKDGQPVKTYLRQTLRFRVAG
jgi:periplasmic protein TonB